MFTVPMRLQVRLESAQQGDPIAGLPLQGPVAVQPLHELTFPLESQAIGDFAESAGRDRSGQLGMTETERSCLTSTPSCSVLQALTGSSYCSNRVFPKLCSLE